MAAGLPAASITTSAPRPAVSCRNAASRSSGDRSSDRVTSAPKVLASSRRAAGAPITITVAAPLSAANAAAERPTGPAPCTRTTSPIWGVARSTAAKQSVSGRVGDAVHAAAGTSVGLPGHQAMPAAAAHFMDIVERDHVAGPKRLAVHVHRHVARLQHLSHAHVPGNDGIGDAGEAAVEEVDSGAAYFTGDGVEEDGAGLEGWVRQVPGLQRLPWSDEDRGANWQDGYRLSVIGYRFLAGEDREPTTDNREQPIIVQRPPLLRCHRPSADLAGTD